LNSTVVDQETNKDNDRSQHHQNHCQYTDQYVAYLFATSIFYATLLALHYQQRLNFSEYFLRLNNLSKEQVHQEIEYNAADLCYLYDVYFTKICIFAMGGARFLRDKVVRMVDATRSSGVNRAYSYKGVYRIQDR
jgi:hypothetical protein